MSGSYWTSTQRLEWQCSRSELQSRRQRLWRWEIGRWPQGLQLQSAGDSTETAESAGDTSTDASASASSAPHSTPRTLPIHHRDLHYDKDYNLRIYCFLLVMKLGRRLNIRQTALATAHVYLSRFMLAASVREANLYLLVTTCVYLACKVEECPQYIRALVSEARSLWPEFVPPDPTKVTEFEFYLVEELGGWLEVHHAYDQIDALQRASGIPLAPDDIQQCWALLNDSYITDAHLVYPPHITAAACMFVTLQVRRPQAQARYAQFLASAQIDLEEVQQVVQDMVTLYDHWDRYHEQWVKYLLRVLYLQRV